MLSRILDFIEYYLRLFIMFITDYLPVKVIRHKGRPFLYRYHLFSLTNDGPGICIHHFVASDPDRGYHDHPWNQALSFILCGGYDERILNDDKKTYVTHRRNRFTFNYLKGNGVYHRVILGEGKDAWTIFFFGKRSKVWSMVGLDGEKKQMSQTIKDNDGGWWNHVIKGLGIHQHLELEGKVISTVDIIVIAESKVLLIKRGKNPYKNCWAFPGGRIDPTDDDILAAAKRELKEETHLENVPLKYVKTIGNKYRDPRGFTSTSIFISMLDSIPTNVSADDDAVDHGWFDYEDITNLPEMAFDHGDILRDVLDKNNNINKNI